jgi:putative heme iron utilization protein
VAEKININTVRSEYHSLRETSQSVQMATISEEGLPEASYAPFVWYDDACYLFLSLLARHTQNLNVNPSLSLLLIEDEAEARNQFARRRIIWQGQAEKIERDVDLFKAVMQAFRDRFGDFIDIIEPLQDFQLFKVTPKSGRFIRGFAQAFQLSGEGLNQITHINPDGSKPT